MGYDTRFEGVVTVDPPLNFAERAYLRLFASTRRMDRGNGPYFVDGTGFSGQGHDGDIIDYNSPPGGQPGLWCKWAPSDDGTEIAWTGAEKFYHAEAWMKYLIDHFLKPGAEALQSSDARFADFTFDHVVNGEIAAYGEDPTDQWRLVVRDNGVAVQRMMTAWGDPVEV